MRFRCPHCNTPSFVRNSEQQSPTLTHVYLQCRNLPCSFAWRVDANAVVTLSPSGMPRKDIDLPSSSAKRASMLISRRGSTEVDHSQTELEGLI